MKFTPIFTFLTLSTSKSSTPKLKICKNCKFFRPNNRECTYFSETDMVTGKKTYEYAFSMRNKESNCGVNATYYEENKFKIITTPYYFIGDYFTYIFPSISIAIIGATIIISIINIKLRNTYTIEDSKPHFSVK